MQRTEKNKKIVPRQPWEGPHGHQPHQQDLLYAWQCFPVRRFRISEEAQVLGALLQLLYIIQNLHQFYKFIGFIYPFIAPQEWSCSLQLQAASLAPPVGDRHHPGQASPKAKKGIGSAETKKAKLSTSLQGWSLRSFPFGTLRSFLF